MSDKHKPRKRRDSSLYKSVEEQQQLRTAADDTADHEKSGFKFVLSSRDPEVVPVEHQAVIEELTAKLTEIETNRQQLETDLGSNNSANKLQIAQIKGRLADLKRKKGEIEALLGSRRAAASDEDATP